MLKKALLVGINAYPAAPLRGCLNDVAQMRDMLTGTFGFSASDIKILQDGEATTDGIAAGLKWLAEGGAGSDGSDVRVFHYSGHGTQVDDQNGDEPDGADEAICPVDYETKGFFIDDDLCKLYALMPPTSNFTILMDCCHSGTIQRDLGRDIVYRYLEPSPEVADRIAAAQQKFEAEREEWVIKQAGAMQGMTPDQIRAELRKLSTQFNTSRARFGDVTNRESNVLFAGCKNIQTSADAFINGEYHGAFTYYFVDAIKALGSSATARQVASSTGSALRTNRYTQVPQLEGTTTNKDRPIFGSFG